MELGKLFGNETAAKCLLFLTRYDEATSGEIAEAFDVPKTMIYLQLVKLEKAGILSSRSVSTIRLFSLNSRSGIREELKALLEKYIEQNMPMASNKKFYSLRRRPRRTGKELRLRDE